MATWTTCTRCLGSHWDPVITDTLRMQMSLCRLCGGSGGSWSTPNAPTEPPKKRCQECGKDSRKWDLCFNCFLVDLRDKWLERQKEEPMPSDKQVIEDAVKEAESEALSLGKTLDVEDCTFCSGHMMYHGAKCEWDGFHEDGKLEAIADIRRQMTRAAKRRKKLADRLRPKGMETFLINRGPLARLTTLIEPLLWGVVGAICYEAITRFFS